MVPRIADLEDVPAHPSGRSCLAVEKMSGAPGYWNDNRTHPFFILWESEAVRR